MSTNQTYREFRESLFKDASHTRRQALQYKAVRPIFNEVINRVLDDYGLAARLSVAKKSGSKLRLLQLNCVEGLYLHELARQLEERDLLQGADLYGISEEPNQVAIAEEYSKISYPPRPYLNFYLHDLHQPLETCPGLREGPARQGPAQFDFIFGAHETLILTKGAREVAGQLYQNNLKGGGLLSFSELTLFQGPGGWVEPHPAMGDLLRVGLIPLRSYNPEVEVAVDLVHWLQDLGAEQSLSYQMVLENGGHSEQGRNLLQSTLMFLYSAGPEFVAAGLISQTQFDEFLRIIFSELTPHHIGKAIYVTTIARKPL